MDGVPIRIEGLKRVWHGGVFENECWFEGWWAYHQAPVAPREVGFWNWCVEEEVWYKREFPFDQSGRLLFKIQGERFRENVKRMKRDKATTKYWYLKNHLFK